MTRVVALAGYRAFLLGRDGQAHLASRRLERREAFFTALAADPVRAALRVDRPTFARNLARWHPDVALDPRLLWLLATAKANRAERYAVSLERRRDRIVPSDVIRTHITLQEDYHTRLLAEVVAMFDLPLGDEPPPAPIRAIVRAVVSTPERLALPLIGASELAGCVVFKMLGERGTALFADDPPVAARIRCLYDEILGDEISHVGYVAARLGRGGLAIMRGLIRVLGPQLVTGFPEMTRLFDVRAMRNQCRAALDLRALAADVPGLAYVAAGLSPRTAGG